jgi:hypothetical protein
MAVENGHTKMAYVALAGAYVALQCGTEFTLQAPCYHRFRAGIPPWVVVLTNYG